MDFEKISEELQKFNSERDWDQFHNLKDLASAINIEASELQEHFLWKKEDEISSILNLKREKIEEEVADIMTFLTMFVKKANIDLGDAVLKKIEKNKEKYPVSKVKGDSRKYSEY